MVGTNSAASTGGAGVSGLAGVGTTGSTAAAGVSGSACGFDPSDEDLSVGTPGLAAIGFSSGAAEAVGGFTAAAGGGATTTTGRVVATTPAGDFHPADEDLSVGTTMGGLATTAPDGGRLATAGGAVGAEMMGGAWRGCGKILRGSGRAGAAATGGAADTVRTTGGAGCAGGATGFAGMRA